MLHNDPNINVRLAALSLMEKYGEDKHISTSLVNALQTQDDPIVQLGLVRYLGARKDKRIDDKLQALAENPETFAAVRDEAYSILLTQDKL